MTVSVKPSTSCSAVFELNELLRSPPPTMVDSNNAPSSYDRYTSLLQHAAGVRFNAMQVAIAVRQTISIAENVLC